MSTKRPRNQAEAIEARDHQVYRLKISLADLDAPIWRRLEVYGGIDMESLASAIDSVFGWSGDHLGEFDLKGLRIGDGTDWRLEDPRAEKEDLSRIRELVRKSGGDKQKSQLIFDVFSSFMPKHQETSAETEADGESNSPTLWELVPRVRTKFKYIYDFGDSWKHVIEVEKIMDAEPGVQYPRCTDGARADPVEDCGGPWDHEQLVEAADNPKHERYADLEEWGLNKWDPEKFSAEEADRKLGKLFRRRKPRTPK